LKEKGFYEQFRDNNVAKYQRHEISELILICMNQWQCLMFRLVNKVQTALLEGLLTDTIDNRLKIAVDRWIENRERWELINSPLS
jgi:hypothetical protein